jgi:hypothetical protein
MKNKKAKRFVLFKVTKKLETFEKRREKSDDTSEKERALCSFSGVAFVARANR